MFFWSRLQILVRPFRVADRDVTLVTLRSFEEANESLFGPEMRSHFVFGR
jgi:hypothetical protein